MVSMGHSKCLGEGSNPSDPVIRADPYNTTEIVETRRVPWRLKHASACFFIDKILKFCYNISVRRKEMTKEEKEVFTKRLSEIVNLIDKNGSTYTFKVVNELFDGAIHISDEVLREKLILAHMKPNLQYIVVEYADGWDEKYYKNIHYILSDTSYSVENSTLKSDSYEDTCNIVSGLYKYFD